MTGGAQPPTGSRAWWSTTLVALGTFAGAWTLSVLVAPGPWRPVTALVVLLVAVTAATARALGRGRWAPSLWALGTAVAAVAALYGGEGSRPIVPLPTPDLLERVQRLGTAGITAVVDGQVPVDPTRGIELLVVAGAALVVVLTDLLATGLGRGGLAGVPLLALWLPVLLFERDPGPAVLVAGGAAFLGLLATTRPRVRRTTGAGRELAPVAAASLAVALVAVAAGPALAALPFFGAVRLPSGWGTAGAQGPLSLSTELDMRSSLGERSDRAILTYTTDAEQLGPLRMYTMVEFDGREWRRSGGADLEQAAGVLWPTEPSTTGETSVLRVRIGELDGDRLPIPVEPRVVDVDGTWLYDPERDEVVGAGVASTRGLSYTVEIAPRDLSKEALQADEPVALDPEHPLRALPDSQFRDRIVELADEVAGDAATAYDQAIALQSYFRDARNFRYDTEIPAARTDDAVWDFLTTRTGYCVQYATAMTVMARSLGIPARMAVGFLPGRASPEVRGEFIVSGRQAHAWPELWFEDAGWVRFEPTPAVQTGSPPTYADPFAGLPVSPDGNTPLPTSTFTPTGAPTPQGSTGGTTGGGVTVGSAEVPVPYLVGAAAILVVLVAAVTWALLHRARARPAPRGPEEWWAELRERLAVRGITWSDAGTPRQVLAGLREHLARADQDPLVVAESLEALERITAALEVDRYAPRPAPPEDAHLAAWVRTAEQAFVPRVGEPVGVGR